MDDRDLYALCLCIGGLSLIAFLHGRMIAMLADRSATLDADVKFLMDHGVVRETEARP